jgi:ornithine cyclodeaminase/alanine dehydrogenase-like protein (mu-crystallin family)
MLPDMAIVLSESDVRQLLPMPALIDAMAHALRAYSAGEVVQPLRTVIPLGERMTFFGVMPAFQPHPPALGTKLVTVCPANARRGIPTHLATILLMEPATGELLAVVDGRYITEARTAAVSAVSVRALARPDASVLAILGSGVQAHSHLEAIALVRSLSEVRVWSPTAHHRQTFVEQNRNPARTVTASGSVREAVAGADIIVTATSSPRPVLEGAWVSPGAHICAVGACRPDTRELDTDLVVRSRVYVDSRPGALAEAGDLVIPIEEARWTADQIVGELGELLAGRVSGRSSPDEITLFESLGMAVEDIAAADLVFRRAAEVGLGRGLVL